MSIDSFSSIFSLANEPEDIAWFTVGMLGVQAWQWLKCKYKDYRYPEESPHMLKRFNWQYILMAVILMISLAVAVQNQQTFNLASRLAQTTQQCQEQFNRALSVRADINNRDRQLQNDWQEVTLDRLTALINPPSELKNKGIIDPEYITYKGYVDQDYFGEITKIDNARRQNDLIRAQNPYPEPDCGKK